MPRTLGWIRQFHKPESPGSPTLLVFPHAGAGASAYRAFSKALSSKFDVIVFQYPGRQDRAAEPPLGSLPEIAAGAFEEFARSDHNRGVPVAAFGHSMGGWVAFEFARIAEANGVDVAHLTVSAAVAPCNAANKPSHPETDEEILTHLAALEGTNSDVFGNRDLMRLALPVIKADYRACDAYACDEDVRISAPIHALGGDQDPIVTLGDLYGWGKHTDSVEVTMFDGGHFFLNEHTEAIAELLAGELRQSESRS
ncbi:MULTISPECIES: thioesterase II family protein [Mycobacterium]|uniref:Thioesterase TesA n=1 Tax=Mycobacterium kiyosense TaxID=2871094 RepID=A0A9P3Q9M4_9MYCO|nr:MULTISPECIES: alpha/beta fold hydrolase [Mycobacterium]BDB41666.1 putative phenyloxazoline synthase MbtB/thioesterase [Mycobacterium kiyosense]BDE15037.1 putative phenyloxazoline synthase MbtB/thioesterase [Mycobacterium sp. 20KCMC460]GLB82539.1 putative phenyloxazoline synthase MbtB/thioesterase [Mycobacterium kiyosense]GLB87701.1 putative phenyloxazoline synthase MbtB/thioesterase [Mycobacterium kiyosense]GLB97519.1 putative phenyloxazoline synthase MbtB/thioesterase [Mycobacterium kiyose